MLFGDNLLDFTDPKNLLLKNVKTRTEACKRFLAKVYYFSPNPMYGSWESTLYHNQYEISKNEKDELRKSSIKQFNPKTGEVK